MTRHDGAWEQGCGRRPKKKVGGGKKLKTNKIRTLHDSPAKKERKRKEVAKHKKSCEMVEKGSKWN